MIDEAKRWETILAQTCTVSGEQGTVTMTMTELKKGGFCCGNYPEVCDRTPDEIVEYAEALADWVYEFRRKRAER